MAEPRVVSLIASATEIACALGYADRLVARSHECDYPPEVVADLPALTAPKLNVGAASGEIDRQVKDLVRDGLGVYTVDADRLKALRPDVILTQDQCEVCAVSLAEVEAAVLDWAGGSPAIVSCRPDGLADVWSDIGRIAEALGAGERGRVLVEGLKARMTVIAARAEALPARPGVLSLEWVDPLMAAGNWMPELVEMAGGENLFGEAGRHSPWIDWEAVVEVDPEVIVALPCGYGIDRTGRDLARLAERREWPRLEAVREGRVYVTDGNQYFNRPGPRLAESLEILAEILHPEAFHFGHEGTGWVRWRS